MAEVRFICRLTALTVAGFVAGALSACHRDALPYARRSPPLGPSARAAGGPPAYIGRWAVTPAACQDKAWELAVNRLQSPGAFTCSLDHVDATPAGYVTYGVCQVGKAQTPGRLVFTLTQLGGPSLTVSGGPFQEPVALVRCAGRVQQQSAEAAAPAQG